MRSEAALVGTAAMTYTARCEHCAVDGYDADADPASFTAALRSHGEAYLRL